MAYTTPSTQPTGTLITSTMYKAHLVDNIKFLHGQPTARVSRDAVQAIPNNTWTAITFDTEDWDSNTMWSSTADEKVFARTAGKYLVNFHAGYAGSTAGNYRSIGINKNSTTGPPSEVIVTAGFDFVTGSGVDLGCSEIVSLTTGQFVCGMLLHNIGVNLNTSTASGSQPRLSMLWVSS